MSVSIPNSAEILSYIEKNIYCEGFKCFEPKHPPISLIKFLENGHHRVLFYYLESYRDLVLIEKPEEDIIKFINQMFIKKITASERISALNLLCEYSDLIDNQSFLIIKKQFFLWLTLIRENWIKGTEDDKQIIKEIRKGYETLFSKIPGHKAQLFKEKSVNVEGKLYSTSLFLLGLEEQEAQELQARYPENNKISYSSLSAIEQSRWFSYHFERNPIESFNGLIKPLEEFLLSDNFYYRSDEKKFNFSLFDLVYILHKSIPNYDQQILVNELKKVSNETWITVNSQSYSIELIEQDVPLVAKKLIEFYGLSRVIKLIISALSLEVIQIKDTFCMMEEYKELLTASKVLPEKPKSLKEIHDFLSKLPKKINSNTKMHQEWQSKLEGKDVGSGYKIHFLETEADFVLAGVLLGICVGNGDYRIRVRSQRSQIFVLKNSQGEVCYCVEYAKIQGLSSFLDDNMSYVLNNSNLNEWELRQAKGQANMQMPKDLERKVQQVVSGAVSNTNKKLELSPVNMVRLLFDLAPILKTITASLITLFSLLVMGFVAYKVVNWDKEKEIVTFSKQYYESWIEKVKTSSSPLVFLAESSSSSVENCFQLRGENFISNDKGYFLVTLDGAVVASQRWDLTQNSMTKSPEIKYSYCTKSSPKEVVIEMISDKDDSKVLRLSARYKEIIKEKNE